MRAKAPSICAISRPSYGLESSLPRPRIAVCRSVRASEIRSFLSLSRPPTRLPLVGTNLTLLPSSASISAQRSSQVFCRFSQNSAVVPKHRDRPRAVSAETPLCPLSMVVIRLAGTPSARANAFAERSRSSISSRRISPGCTGGILFVTVMSTSSVVVLDCYVVWPVIRPTKTDPPLPIDPDAVLACPIPP